VPVVKPEQLQHLAVNEKLVELYRMRIQKIAELKDAYSNTANPFLLKAPPPLLLYRKYSNYDIRTGI
jgi:hypothetical protein